MKKLLLYCFFIFTGYTLQAQGGNRLEALKIAYITKKMELSPEEAQRFWPVYNQYSAELRQARQYAKRSNENEIDLDENVLKIRKKYNSQLSQTLSPEKVNAFFKAEKEFGQYVQEEMKKRQLRQQGHTPSNP